MLIVKSLSRAGLQPMSLQVEDGACLAITGPSGAGKSLLMRAIADLDPNSGDVSTGQLNRSDTTAPAWRRNVAFLPSETGWWQDDVGAHFSDHEGTKARLPLVGLSTDALNWKVTRLSSGEKHRLGLLRCLETSPAVLLLDEPTAALDQETTLQVEALLRDQMDKGVSILLVTHDADQPHRLGCPTLRMENGAMVT